MKCPACKNSHLTISRLEEGLPVYSCKQCSGAMVSLLHYRDWAERTACELESDTPVDEVVVESDSTRAMSCPKCQRLMTKYSISGQSSHKLDLCGGCDEAWLDGGEWELLKSLKLAKDIPAVFTDTWQKSVRAEQQEARHKERFAKIVGDEDMAKADEVRQWLKDHPKRAELLFFLGAD